MIQGLREPNKYRRPAPGVVNATPAANPSGLAAGALAATVSRWR
jgi:hypothetical protein